MLIRRPSLPVFPVCSEGVLPYGCIWCIEGTPTGSVGVSQADLAALLLATTIFKQVTNLATLVISTMLTAGEGPSDAEVARETEKRAMAAPAPGAD